VCGSPTGVDPHDLTEEVTADAMSTCAASVLDQEEMHRAGGAFVRLSD
jgi:hypothetical protein